MADLGWAVKTRPVVIVSRDDPDPPRALFIDIPLTRRSRGSRYEVPLGHLPWLANESVASVQGIGSLPAARFERRIGVLPRDDLVKVKRALAFACDMLE